MSAVAVLIGGIAVCGIAMMGAASTSSPDVTSSAERPSIVPTETTTVIVAPTGISASRAKIPVAPRQLR